MPRSMPSHGDGEPNIHKLTGNRLWERTRWSRSSRTFRSEAAVRHRVTGDVEGLTRHTAQQQEHDHRGSKRANSIG
jgi:hypothetical protein